MSFPRHEKYKASGVEWLGKVPAQWQTRRLKFLFDLVKRQPRLEDGIVTAFRDGEVTLRANRRVEGFTNAVHEIGYQGIRPGDLVIHAMDAFAGAIGVSDSEGKSTPVYSVCTPVDPEINARYYAALLRHMALSGYVNALAKGIRERSTEFRWADASEVVLPVPSGDEQGCIVAFLDRETAKIDALIADQRRLIELLKEKRQAVISQAVTKGLNPNVPMKDSGVEWLGKVPAHWDVLRVKTASTFLTSGPRGWSDQVSEEGALFVQSGDLTETLGIDFDNVKRVAVADDAEARRTQLKVGDVLVCITGAKTGKVAVCEQMDEPAFINQHICLIRPAAGLRSSYLGAYLHSEAGQRYFELAQYGLKQGLSLEEVKQAAVPVPPRLEQDQIVDKVNRLATALGGLTLAGEMSIALLHERRSALISAAVTGKIDVRGQVPQPEAVAA